MNQPAHIPGRPAGAAGRCDLWGRAQRSPVSPSLAFRHVSQGTTSPATPPRNAVPAVLLRHLLLHGLLQDHDTEEALPTEGPLNCGFSSGSGI
jgi:hypothetical protein